MLLTEMAILDLRVRFMNLKDSLRRIFGLPVSRVDVFSPEPGSIVTPIVSPQSDEIAQVVEPEVFRWRRHPLLRNASGKSGLSGKEQRARRMAVQGLYAGLRGDAERAQQLFVHALAEAHIDLMEIPSFWQMPRGAIVAAADAYEQAGRLRDATALRARIRSELRPRNVVQLRPVEVLPERKHSAGGL